MENNSEGTGARSKLDAVLKGLVEKTETEREQSDVDPGKMTVESLNKDLSPLSAGKRPSTRFPQHRRKKRKEMDEGIPESNPYKQNAYVIKLFDRSVDLAQFNTSTPLYPICRAWMRNNPLVREPLGSPSSPHSMTEDEATEMINGKCQNVYRLPSPTSCPLSSCGEPVNLRIPPMEKPTASPLTDVTTPRSLLCDHMERWKKIRQKWKECSNKNQLRYGESIKILKEMKELYEN
ncbi:protein lin-37 homolog isoform X2 [Gouania willdenowi]|uniref:Lin-37 n=1 Tax=Gouania willdenowi TaxID=441366 RepID=A0A8C5G1J7_GOUWI|nr:protein lin-37 homolog isoform X2 [Gouania willdenowi]XP_028326000.1 protein lin-37 homolog isoform X2 [Gouania willdenowi]